MSRPVTTLAFFFIALSLFSTMLTGTGVAETLHLNQRVGGDESVNEVRNQAQNLSSGAPTGQTLFGMYNVLSSQISTLFGMLNPGMVMLYNAGGPAFLFGNPENDVIGFLPPLVTFIKAIGIISFLRGWGL